MKMCKQAAKFGTDCGKSICCMECEDKGNCNQVCSNVKENCPDAFNEENALAVMQADVPEVINKIISLTLQKKAIEADEKEMKVQLQAAMERYGVKKFESEQVSFTYVPKTTKTTIDSKLLKAEQPGIAEKYSKTSSVSAYVKVAVK